MGNLLNIFSPYDKNRPLRVICRAGKRPEITVYSIEINIGDFNIYFPWRMSWTNRIFYLFIMYSTGKIHVYLTGIIDISA